jgi:hypothetical protein
MVLVQTAQRPQSSRHRGDATEVVAALPSGRAGQLPSTDLLGPQPDPDRVLVNACPGLYPQACVSLDVGFVVHRLHRAPHEDAPAGLGGDVDTVHLIGNTTRGLRDLQLRPQVVRKTMVVPRRRGSPEARRDRPGRRRRCARPGRTSAVRGSRPDRGRLDHINYNLRAASSPPALLAGPSDALAWVGGQLSTVLVFALVAAVAVDRWALSRWRAACGDLFLAGETASGLGGGPLLQCALVGGPWSTYTTWRFVLARRAVLFACAAGVDEPAMRAAVAT